jgi:hypothetical protein
MSDSIKVTDQILLEKCPRSPNFQASIKNPETGKWKKLSTGTSDIKEAEQFALKKLSEWRFLLKRGETTISKQTFATVAEKYLKRLQKDTDEEYATESQKIYKGIFRTGCFRSLVQMKSTR